MHGNDGFGPGRDRLLELNRIQTERFGIDIHDHRRGSDIDGGFRGGDPGDARNNDFIAGADPQREQRAFERGGAVAHPDSIFRVLERGEFLHQQLFIFAAKPPFAGVIHFQQFSIGFRVDLRPGRDEFCQFSRLKNRGSAVNCQFVHIDSSMVNRLDAANSAI